MVEENQYFFSKYQAWDLAKVCVVILNVAILIIGPIMLGAVVWYDSNNVNLIRKNLISQMLINLCKSLIIVCIINGIFYFIRLIFTPMSLNQCDGPEFFGRWTFVYLFTHTCLRQFFKVLYLYKWKLAISLNDDFFAFFATVMVAVFATCFTFASYMLGFHHSDLDFHICTGNHPLENIKVAMKHLKLPFNETNTKWFPSHYIRDPMSNFSVIMLCLFVLFLTLTWYL